MFVTIRSYNSLKKADFIKYKLGLAGVECKTISQKEGTQNSPKYKIEVLAEQAEKAVQVLLTLAAEYPKEDFELKNDPNGLLHILIPIDFSVKSFEAAKYTIEIAKRRPVEIKFLHVWNDDLDDFIAERGSLEIEDFKRLQCNEIKRNINNSLDVFRQKLNKLIDETKTRDNLLYHFTIVEGEVSRQIEKTIYRCKPQLIIIAHNTDKDFRFRISREIASGIINLAYCPVFYIPQKLYHHPIEKLHVMYITNFDKNVYQSFKIFQEITNGFDTNINITHVAQEGSEKQVQEKMDTLVKELQAIKELKELKIKSTILNNKDLLKGFDTYIEENHIDIISFISQEYSIWHKLFNPDNLRNLMNGSTLPLLVFKYKG